MNGEHENETCEHLDLIRSVVTGPPEHVIRKAIALAQERTRERSLVTEEE